MLCEAGETELPFQVDGVYIGREIHQSSSGWTVLTESRLHNGCDVVNGVKKSNVPNQSQWKLSP